MVAFATFLTAAFVTSHDSTSTRYGSGTKLRTTVNVNDNNNDNNKPSIHQDEDGTCVYGLKSYWDDMYQGDNSNSDSSDQLPAELYSWYCGWDELAPFWTMLVPDPTARVLVAGIGNDPTPIEMYDAGWNTSMTAFDYSEAGVARASQLFGVSRTQNVQLLTADARNLPLPDASIDATLDKGTLDAIYITGKDVFHDSVTELARVTAEQGVVVCVSRVIMPNELMAAFDARLWEVIHDGELAFAPDGEATIDLGAELYSWRRRKEITATAL
mmetsp:Transcript_13068/g.21626  ORF Transcript_13068/g.21626 Transcript_13068/m.21626 type:complete len:271 (+) Transcript_13068:180-992(+)|eukprot:CAMPEP_0119009884 /NCGR_PEP_ID=MMETSP1176-20130426/4660_1 /TAXON_ID=265551 /ORGANISM="Synedropsis recta cf, Strain CCMP1620" /LENGTH=270 /DNA_ID=CAMNT_0006962467 /DNA_START=172 /DNA_END=984 /DNA_ORIENTATION=-